MSLGGLTEAVDALVVSDPAHFADAESIEALHREMARLEAFTTTVVASFDASGRWTDDGAASPSAWLATRCKLPRDEARRRVRVGRQLRHLPVTTDAWLSGSIASAQASAICHARRATTEAAMARDEGMLVGQARTLRFEWFKKALRYWEQLADADGAEDADAARREARDVWLAESLDGCFLGRITLDPISGAIVSDELERRAQDLFEADWAQAKEQLGRDPRPEELQRTPGQRRADALVEMATRSKTVPADGRRPSPLFSVFVGYETFHGRICELAQGTVLAPGSLLPWLDHAMIERAVFGPERRVEIGATARLFTGAVRRAVELRDRVCTHPYCDRPAERCEVDHILPYSAGGLTTQENGRLLCGYHNRLRNQRPPPAA